MRDHFGLGFFFHHFVGFDGQIASGVGNVAKRTPDGDGCADIGERASQITGLEHFHIHDGLVGFHRGYNVAAFNFVAGLFFPGDDHALGHGVRKLGHGYRIVLGHA